jgi:hypothetical protein
MLNSDNFDLAELFPAAVPPPIIVNIGEDTWVAFPKTIFRMYSSKVSVPDIN